jgi:hypothetical protein
MSNHQETDKSFVIFECITKGGKALHRAMDTMPSEYTSDAESNKVCCECMGCCVFWPLYLVFDILSCPIRGCIHLKNKK